MSYPKAAFLPGVISAALMLTIVSRPVLARTYDNIEVYGFLLGNFTGRTSGQRPGGGESKDFLLAEERLRLEASVWSDSVELSARVKADFFHDAVAGDLNIDLREAYVDYTAGDFDFRLGRQIATWGVGDLLFINDVFPKDWVSFFSGRPLEYLKVGVDGFRILHSSDPLNVEFLLVPIFEPGNLPTPERFFLFDPFPEDSVRDEQLPAKTLGNAELAFRLYRKIKDVDVSVYAYRGFWRTPSLQPDSLASPMIVTASYSRLSVYGFSAQGSALRGILGFETGYYHSRDDKPGEDPTVPNSQVRFLLGYQRQLWEDFILGTQYYAEIMKNYSSYLQTLPPDFPAQNRYRDTITLRLEQLLGHQTWKLSMFTFYSPADGDYLVQPQMSYKFSDHLTSTLGANLFGGEKDTTSLGQFDKNDNVYLSVRFDF